MNLVFLSPHFPPYFERFCAGLRSRGVTVLGIGDCDYGALTDGLKGALSEYYRVDNLENYEDLHRACGYFIHKYGRLDYIESLNEHWLITEAKLRTDFNVPGTKYPDVWEFKRKSAMKKYFKQAGISCARYSLTGDLKEALAFAKEVGYPIVAKPDSGVGAVDSFKIMNEADLRGFIGKNLHGYIMEEYVNGEILTFEGLADSDGRVIFYSSHVMLLKPMESVNDDNHISFYGDRDVPDDVVKAGKAMAKAYDLRNVFFHFEFFRLGEDKPALGKKGDIVGLEVNMRPPGGLITELINYTYDIDIYEAWASMIAFNTIPEHIRAKRFAGYASRKYRKDYAHTNEEIYEKYGGHIIVKYEIEPIFAKTMGDYTYLFWADDTKKLLEIVNYIQAENAKA